MLSLFISIALAQTPLWPRTPPDSIKLTQSETNENGTIKNVSTPTLEIFKPKKPNGSAIVVFPGGGYRVLAYGFEGTEICNWLTPLGYTCAVVKYRVPDSGEAWHPECRCHIIPPHPTALEDAQRAIRLTRRATGLKRVGVIGFSAGGHLVAETSTRFGEKIYEPQDDIDKESARPDFAIAMYPGHIWNEEKQFVTVKVPSDAPPTFIVQAVDDPVDSVKNSMKYGEALQAAHIPTELHLFAEGGHAFGLCKTKKPICDWPQLAEAWLKSLH